MAEQTQPTRQRTTARERMLERLHGRRMPDLLASTFNEHGNIKAAARALDASRGTVERWLDKWGVEIIPAQAVLAEDDAAAMIEAAEADREPVTA